MLRKIVVVLVLAAAPAGAPVAAQSSWFQPSLLDKPEKRTALAVAATDH